MRGLGAAFGPFDLVVRAVDLHAPGLVRIPELADDLESLLQGNDGLPRLQAPPAHSGNLIPECASPDAQLKAPATQEIQTGRTAGEHRGLPQGEVEDIATDVDALGARGDVGKQRSGIMIPRLVRVVFKRH